MALVMDAPAAPHLGEDRGPRAESIVLATHGIVIGSGRCVGGTGACELPFAKVFLILGHICPTLSSMTGNEFIRKIRSLGRKRGVKVAFVPERGKGSHGTLYYGEKLTIVRNPKDELKTGTSTRC
jgi:mRNA interferase HicA